MAAKKRDARKPNEGVDAVAHDGGEGDEIRLRLPLLVPAGGTALHRFKGLQLGEYVLDFDGHGITLRCAAIHAPPPVQRNGQLSEDREVGV
jgi:hypothetical protein